MGDDDQQFCLRWNNHQTTLIQNFDTLLESGTLVDCTLAAEGKYLKAHKVVLSACSPYFEGLLSEHYDKHPVFILKDVKFKELKAMMDYMYRGEVNISQDQLAALLKAAESLQIKGLSESKTGSGGNTSGSSKAETRSQKTAPQPTAPSLDIPHSSSGLTIEKNSKVPRQSLAQTSVGDLPEDSASPSLSKGISSREGSVSPNGRKRKRYRRRSLNDDNPIDNHETSNSSDMSHQPMNVPAPGVAPIADEKSMSESADSLGRSALMQQLTKPADEMLQMPVEKPEPNDTLIEPKSEYLEDPEESVEDLTLDDDFNDTNDLEPDNNRAGPSHDSSHPGHASWHVTGDRSNAGGVVGSVAGAPGSNDEVFMAAQEAANAHRDSQDIKYPRVMLIKCEDPTADYDLLQIKNKRYLCTNQMCDRIFNHERDRDYHMKYSCNEQSPRFRCGYCDFESKISAKVNIHLSKVHSNYKRKIRKVTSNILSPDANHHQCPNCRKIYIHKRTYMKHINFECGDNPRFLCCYCDYKNNRKTVPRIRLTNRGRQFSTPELLNAEKYYYCENKNCNRAFKNRRHRNYHMKHFCGKPPRFKCGYCTHTSYFNNRRVSIRRRRRLAKKKFDKKKAYSCENSNCNRSFKTIYSLNAHIKYECNKLPRFQCNYCDYKSYRFSNIKRHSARIHLNYPINVIDSYNCGFEMKILS
ncbi:B-cell CLL/lymphoma 6 member B protein-like isoform X4 [Microplitis mediator]|uniref:B-cell CLL/lymphoma 6 member B protein-like isoform X4 n=1 Tax=Microplitis mediator TaxID=375433 RepID=UPI00255768A6|nr:B-cell CLL/lymphoma 6 member B protein-like isoform X4 [Microplitis mediator]